MIMQLQQAVKVVAFVLIRQMSRVSVPASCNPSAILLAAAS